eukprot:scaffold2357_cov167-Amphora_coffeaeformis.AAC.17
MERMSVMMWNVKPTPSLSLSVFGPIDVGGLQKQHRRQPTSEHPPSNTIHFPPLLVLLTRNHHMIDLLKYCTFAGEQCCLRRSDRTAKETQPQTWSQEDCHIPIFPPAWCIISTLNAFKVWYHHNISAAVLLDQRSCEKSGLEKFRSSQVTDMTHKGPRKNLVRQRERVLSPR